MGVLKSVADDRAQARWTTSSNTISQTYWDNRIRVEISRRVVRTLTILVLYYLVRSVLTESGP